MTQLNKKLYDVLTAEQIELSCAEALLKLGADPLKGWTEDDPCDCLIGELLCETQDNEMLGSRFPEILELFYRYGMDLSAKSKECDNDLNMNPLWNLAFNCSENGLKNLKSLLDHGVDVNSVEMMVEHILVDMELMSFNAVKELEEWFYHHDIFSIKMIMLAASYKNIIDNSPYLKQNIGYDQNVFDLIKFRNWDNFDYHIECSESVERPTYSNAVITISQKGSDNSVWTIKL